MSLSLTSAEFEDGADFPQRHTCNGANVSPPLDISGVPANAVSLALIFDDPDAAKEPAGIGRTFDHWLVFNIDSSTTTIEEDSFPSGAEFGLNDLERGEYGGPCPPTFRHKYFFRLFALDSELSFDTMPTKSELESAIKDHLIEEVELTVYYEQPAAS
jgi:hypothetical protein